MTRANILERHAFWGSYVFLAYRNRRHLVIRLPIRGETAHALSPAAAVSERDCDRSRFGLQI